MIGNTNPYRWLGDSRRLESGRRGEARLGLIVDRLNPLGECSPTHSQLRYGAYELPMVEIGLIAMDGAIGYQGVCKRTR